MFHKFWRIPWKCTSSWFGNRINLCKFAKFVAITRKFREECEAASEAVAGGALQAARAQLLQNSSLFGSQWWRKGPSRLSGTLAWCCTAHLGHVPYPRYNNSWLLAFAHLAGSKRGEMQPCSLPASTGCSAVHLCMELSPRWEHWL